MTAVSVLIQVKFFRRCRAFPALDWHISRVYDALAELLTTRIILILAHDHLSLALIILTLEFMVAVRLILESTNRYRETHCLLYRLDFASDFCFSVRAS